jgi:hypothetical protein
MQEKGEPQGSPSFSSCRPQPALCAPRRRFRAATRRSDYWQSPDGIAPHSAWTGDAAEVSFATAAAQVLPVKLTVELVVTALVMAAMFVNVLFDA